MKDEEISWQNPIRWLYDWVLSWADTKYGELSLFVLAFTEATFFPVPPDVLLVALILGARSKAYRLATICTIGSLLGAISGFGLGYFFWSAVDSFFFTYLIEESTFHTVRDLYDKNLFVIVVSAALSPIPFKVFTVASGVFAENYTGGRLMGFIVQFLLASAVGRAVRFFAIGYLLHRFGEPVRDWIETYFNLITLLVVFVLLLVLLLSRWI